MRFYLSVLILTCGASTVFAGWKDDIGFTDLQTRLGGSTPTGASIIVTHVEAQFGGNYMPDTGHAEFSGKTITAKSGSSGSSLHATDVGRFYYGLSTSISPGIDTIDAYEANNWLNSGFIRLQNSNAPWPEVNRIQNHSWIGSYGNNTYDIDVLRRLDYVVQRDGVVVATGVNNGAGTSMPNLLGSAYNVLAVGMSDGISSYGPTALDEAGRVKPDIVAWIDPPFDMTSWATPVVAGAGALLLETADADSSLNYMSRTDKALLAKALLMGGATKDEFTDWRKGFSTPSTDGTVPLDYRYGAGELNIDNSHRILTSGEQDASGSSDVSTTGWDFGGATASGGQLYFIEIPAYSYVQRLTILVTWFRQIDFTKGPGPNPATFTPSLANIDLRLYKASGFSLGPLRDQSISSIDNVEHIFLKDLVGGRYVIEVTTDDDWDYAITWDMQLAATVAPDFDGDGDVDQDDYNHFESCVTGPNNPQGNPPCQDADLDGDTDVDQEDFGLFQGCLSGLDVLANSVCSL